MRISDWSSDVCSSDLEDLDALELRAPNDGVLMLAANWSGVKPATGASLYAGREFGSLPDAGAMEVELSLPQLESQGVRVGQAVEMFPLGRPQDTIASERSEEHTSELQSLMRTSYAVFCLKK